MSARVDIKWMVENGFQQNESGVWCKVKKIKGSQNASPKPRAHKYGAIAKNVDGVRYDSQREYEFKTMLDFNKIAYQMKEENVLQPEFVYLSEKIKAIKIIPDFTIYSGGRRIAIIDVKGVVLPDFKIKVKILKHKFAFQMQQQIPIFMPKNKGEMDKTIQEILCLLQKK